MCHILLSESKTLFVHIVKPLTTFNHKMAQQLHQVQYFTTESTSMSYIMGSQLVPSTARYTFLQSLPPTLINLTCQELCSDPEELD